MINYYQKDKLNKKSEKPVYFYLSHISDLDFNSKKQTELAQIENYKKIDSFNVKKEQINEIDFSQDVKLNLTSNQIEDSKSLICSQNDEPEPKMNSKTQINNKEDQPIKRNIKQKGKAKAKNNKNNTRKRKTHSESNLSKSLNKSKDSQYSLKSGESTKRSHFLLKTRNIPEKYPEDYQSIDSSSEDEKEEELEKKEINLNNNSNSFYNKMIETGEIMNPNYDSRRDIEEELEGFDLLSFDSKDLFRSDYMKKKFFKDIKAEIKIVYFDKTFRPLHAIFVFNEKNSLHKERKLFSGGYNADEFTSFCTEMIKKNTPVKVELLVNIVDMSYEEGLHLEGINKDLLIDIYFLIDIFNDA